VLASSPGRSSSPTLQRRQDQARPRPQGGIHLVLQVITDDSINMETDQEIARLEELLKKNTITFQKVTKEGLGRIAVQGVLADEEGKTATCSTSTPGTGTSGSAATGPTDAQAPRRPVPPRPVRQPGPRDD